MSEPSAPARTRPEEPALIADSTLALLAAAGESGGFHAPTIGEFFPAALLFEGTPFEFNRIMLVRVIATVVLIAFLAIVASRLRLVPGRVQSATEMVLGFIRTGIAEDVIGKDKARGYVPMLTVIFLATLALNITGIIPLLNIAGTSVIGVPLLMALVAYVAFLYAGIKAHGAGRYFSMSLFPAGVPKPIYILLTPIEFISTFILRPFTLTVRLLANMVAGHLMLVLFFAATQYFFVEANGALKAMGVITLGAGLAFTLFEILIAVLQAYIFTLLTAVYISLSLESEH